MNAAAYGTTVAEEEAKLSKQNSKPSVSASNGSNSSGSSSNMMMSPSLSAGSSMHAQVNPSNGVPPACLYLRQTPINCNALH